MDNEHEQIKETGSKSSESGTKKPLLILAGVSALTAVFAGAATGFDAAAQMGTLDTIELGLLVASGTFLTTMITVPVGAFANAFVFMIAGGGIGAPLGMGAKALGIDFDKKLNLKLSAETSFSQRLKNGLLAGAASGAAAGIILGGIIGAANGIFEGANLGGTHIRDAAMKHFFNKPAAQQTQVLKQPIQYANTEKMTPSAFL